jgi:hypothetical protein
MVSLYRKPIISEKIIILDGISGTGKTLMAPILSSYENIELGKFEYIKECICILTGMGKIDGDTAIHLLNIYADVSIFDSFIGRNINFRYDDLSSVFNTSQKYKYFKRIFSSYSGKNILEQIKINRPPSLIITHQIFPHIDIMFKAYDERLRIIETVRHPLYTIENWYHSIKQCPPGVDPRAYTVTFKFKSFCLPWYVEGWEGQYINSNTMDKAIFSLKALTDLTNKKIDNLSPDKKDKILIIPFENFVLHPFTWLQKINSFIGEKSTKSTIKELKKQKCPRDLVTDGPAKKIYMRYGWKKPFKTEKEVFNDKIKFVKQKSSKEGFKKLLEMSSEYENRYDKWF